MQIGDQLQLYFQPQVDAVGRIDAAEALLRWRHPERGLVLPDHLIPVAEETGLIFPIVYGCSSSMYANTGVVK